MNFHMLLPLVVLLLGLCPVRGFDSCEDFPPVYRPSDCPIRKRYGPHGKCGLPAELRPWWCEGVQTSAPQLCPLRLVSSPETGAPSAIVWNALSQCPWPDLRAAASPTHALPLTRTAPLLMT